MLVFTIIETEIEREKERESQRDRLDEYLRNILQDIPLNIFLPPVTGSTRPGMRNSESDSRT